MGSHTGWIYDCVVCNEQIAYTACADGILCKRNIHQGILLESIPVNQGVASALVKYQVSLYVGIILVNW
jgi:hypothetical protein